MNRPALGAYLSDPSVPAHEKVYLLDVLGQLHGQMLDVGGRGTGAGNTLTIPPHLQADPRFATNLPIDPSLLRAAQQQQAIRAAKGWRDQQMHNPMLAQARMGEGMTTNIDQPLMDPVPVLATAGTSVAAQGMEALLPELLSNAAQEYGFGALSAGMQSLGGAATGGLPQQTRLMYPKPRTSWMYSAGGDDLGQPHRTPTEPLAPYEVGPQGVPRSRLSTYGEDWPEFEPNPYYYPHGVGQKATGPMERVEELSKTQPLNEDADYFNRSVATGPLDPGYFRATQPLDDPMLSLHRTMPLNWSNGGWNPNWENHLQASKTSALSPDDYSLMQLNALQHPDVPRELPPDAMFHGFSVWGAPVDLNEVAKSGLGAGWFSKEPLDFAGPTYAAVSRQHLPPLLSQRHIHPSDPSIEYIPKWRGTNVPKGIPPRRVPAQKLLSSIGGMAGEEGLDPSAGISVHPYHVLLVDQAKNILGRLGKSRAGKKATQLLADFGEILRQAHEGE